MRVLGDSTQHELKVLGEQVVHTGGLARLAAGVANSSPLEVHPVAAGRLPVGPGAVPVACAEEITCLPRRASRTRRLYLPRAAASRRSRTVPRCVRAISFWPAML